jgi:hypothetical protein
MRRLSPIGRLALREWMHTAYIEPAGARCGLKPPRRERETMSDKSMAETEESKKPSDAAAEALVAAERRRMIDRVLTYAALREQAAVMLDEAASGPGPEKPSEGAAERARAQAEVARDIARYLAEEANS